MHPKRLALFALALALPLLASCSSYQVRFFYPQQNAGDFFTDQPDLALYVAEPEDLRPGRERNGSGWVSTFRFPADDKLEQPASSIVRRALMQDLLQTRVATLVQNPELADYSLHTQLLSMTTKLERPWATWVVPLGIGAAVGAAVGEDSSDAIKMGLVTAFFATFIPVPAKTTALVEVRLELRDRETNQVVWEGNCQGSYARTVRMGLTAREDKKLAEEFLPRALKDANACAVGQLYSWFQENGSGG